MIQVDTKGPYKPIIPKAGSTVLINISDCFTICFSVSPTTSPAMSTIPPRRVVITDNADHTTTGGKEHASPETIR